MKDLLGIIGILVISIEIYLWLRRGWIRHVLESKKKAKMLHKPAMMRPKSELDCPHFVIEKGEKANPEQKKAIVAWNDRKGWGGRRKGISTEGYFCSNTGCEYFGVKGERIHALVGNGSHGKQEVIRDLKCQSCGKKFTVRKHTVLYRLKTHSGIVEKVMWLLAVGVDGSVLEEVFGVREVTIRAWLCRSGCSCTRSSSTPSRSPGRTSRRAG